MKKLITLILSAVMVFTLAVGCVSASAATLHPRRSAPIVGGYTQAASPVVTPSIRELVSKATDGLEGAEYTPVAVIDTQVVAGTNYRILCKITPVVPNAQATYNIVTIYQDLQGNAKITDIQESNATAGTNGWKETKTPVVTELSKAVLKKATAGLMDVGYTPVAAVEYKIGLGTIGYALLCRVSSITPNPQDNFVLLYVTSDILGNARIAGEANFTASK